MKDLNDEIKKLLNEYDVALLNQIEKTYNPEPEYFHARRKEVTDVLHAIAVRDAKESKIEKRAAILGKAIKTKRQKQLNSDSWLLFNKIRTAFRAVVYSDDQKMHFTSERCKQLSDEIEQMQIRFEGEK